MVRLSLALVICCICVGQDTIVLTSEAPPGVSPTTISGQVTGPRGTQGIYYWVVTNYPIGNSFPSGPYFLRDAPSILSVTNFVTVRWRGATGALTYDLLKTNTPNIPQAACNCAVATGIAGTVQVDNSNATGAYTIGSQGAVTQFIRLENRNTMLPVMLIYPYTVGILGHLGVSSGLTVEGDISGGSLSADEMISTPEMCIQGGYCINPANEIIGYVPQYSIAWASHDNQLEGHLDLLRVDLGFGGITLDGTLTYVSALAFAGLGAQVNGTTAYCSDCTFANPCAGGGTGAIAKKLGGVWRCD